VGEARPPWDNAMADIRVITMNLQYTTIAAPVSGIVSQKSAQPSQNVAVDQQLKKLKGRLEKAF